MESCEPDLRLVAAVEGTRRRLLSSLPRRARVKRGPEDKRNARTDEHEPKKSLDDHSPLEARRELRVDPLKVSKLKRRKEENEFIHSLLYFLVP